MLIYIAIFLVSYMLTKTLLHKFQHLPPTPFPSLPILGHLHLLHSPTHIHRTLANISNRYGPVVQLWLGFRRTLLVSSASAAQDCLHHNDIIFANRPGLIGAKILSYDYTTMLWASYGPLWRNHRRIASTEILSPKRVQMYASIRADEVKSLVKKIYDQLVRGDNVIEIKPALIELTNNVMMRMIAGKRVYDGEVESEEGKTFKRLVKELLDVGGAVNGGDLFPFFKYLGLNKAAEKTCRNVFIKLDKFFQELVDEQRMKIKNESGDQSKNSNKNKNLIQVLLGLQRTDPDYFTEDIIKGLIQMLLLTGTETSSSTVEWAATLLLKNPKIHEKARKEIHDKVGYDRLIEEPDLQNLSYLHCIIKETLRMYPVAPILPPHESSKDCVVEGYHIPQGTMLNVNLWAIQNDPNVWDEPSKFKPERFENVEWDHNRVAYNFMPFGSGRRACPGENLASRMLGLTLGALIQCFEWESGQEEIDLEEKVGLTMWKAKPLVAKFNPYQKMIKVVSRIEVLL